MYTNTYDNGDTGWTVNHESEVTIAKVGEGSIEAWSPDEIDGKMLVPGWFGTAPCPTAVRLV